MREHEDLLDEVDSLRSTCRIQSDNVTMLKKRLGELAEAEEENVKLRAIIIKMQLEAL